MDLLPEWIKTPLTDYLELLKREGWCQMYLDQLLEAEKSAFVELPCLKAERTTTVPEVPVMCIKNGHGLSTDIFSLLSPQLLRCLVEAFSHVE